MASSLELAQTFEQPLHADDQAMNIYTYMDNDLFRAARTGDMVALSKYQGDFRFLVDPMLNTALHIYSGTAGGFLVAYSQNFVEALVNKCPSLLVQANCQGEIPLHVAVKRRKIEVVKFIIERSKQLQVQDIRRELLNGLTLEATGTSILRQMLRMTDVEGNTPLHKAVESAHGIVVQLLVEELEADFSFSANKSGETPIYQAARRGYGLVLGMILSKCGSMDDYGTGPDGTSALHAAVLSGTIVPVRDLISKKKDLIKKADDKGRTPLHYAAHLGHYDIMTWLLENDASAAFITDKERGSTALHMAAWQGYVFIIGLIISYCPDCCEIVDKKGWNFLHYAVVTLFPDDLFKLLNDIHANRLFNGNKLIEELFFQWDVHGISPFHVMRFGPAYQRLGPDQFKNLFQNYITAAGGNIAISEYDKKVRQDVQLSVKEIGNIEVAGISVHHCFLNMEEEMNKQEKMEKARDEEKRKMMEQQEKKREKKREKERASKQEFMDKARETHIVVATLIATVTFAAGFTMPGTYDQQLGTAILTHDSAFKAFVVTNTLAFVFSLLAIILHFLLVFFRGASAFYFQYSCVLLADVLTFLAMAAMVIAFSTGAYAVLRPASGFAITACTLGLTFFIGLVLCLVFMACNFSEEGE